uniref:RabBD domain-containing protein n=1 Tax=Hucho hucho TaxID=62062 RepID=A0A4W5QY23_9TELE
MMKSTKDLLEFLDLSHLSPDEELAIRQVLQRDDNLRKRETGRIRRLQISIPDPKKLKVMTGKWFEELRTHRYGQQSDVTEVLRSSMRRKKTTGKDFVLITINQLNNYTLN